MTTCSNCHIFLIHSESAAATWNYGMLLGDSRRMTMIALRRPSTIRFTFSRLASVSIFLCLFALLQVPQVAAMACVESAKAECPCQENGEGSERELAVCSTPRCRLNDHRPSSFNSQNEADDRLYQIASKVNRIPAIVGHQFANGLGAPLLI